MDWSATPTESLRSLLEQELKHTEGLLEHFGLCPQFLEQLNKTLGVYEKLLERDTTISSAFEKRIEHLKKQQ